MRTALTVAAGVAAAAGACYALVTVGTAVVSDRIATAVMPPAAAAARRR